MTERVGAGGAERSRLVVVDPPVPAVGGYYARGRWERRLVWATVAVDLATIVAACLVAVTVQFGVPARNPLRGGLLLAGLSVAWIGAMAVSRAYEARFLGVGSEEFKRVGNAAVRVWAAIGVVAYAVDDNVGRRFVLIALPVATAGNLLARYAARKIVMRLRAAGRCMHRVIVVGNPVGVADLIRHARRAAYAGMQVVGCCIDRPGAVRAVESVPVLGDLSDIPAVIRASRASTVAVTSRGAFTPGDLRRLSWQLEGSGVDILVAPALTDVAGPRIHIRPVAGLPLLHVEEPELSGFRRLLKGGCDRVAAGAALLALAPVFLVVSAAVRLDSPGPAFFRQTRVGRGGRSFTMLKFRSMRADAEAALEALAGHNERGEGLLFKIRKDPRVTRIGRLLRKYSLDELPQLINVLRGDMSLVGPRPPLPTEVANYESDVRRRLLVKPGLTGLWQVSGRSDLTWDESVRLDLEYVENWSLALDAMILWKTLFAVVRGSGAY